MRVELTDLFPLVYEAQVMEVLDGDTLEIKYGNYRWRLRLSRIDAPELKQPYADGTRGAGKLAHHCLKSFTQKYMPIRIEGSDIYGRLLGEAGNANRLMIENGCAVLYPYARFSSKQEKWQFLRAHLRAMRERRGLWKNVGIKHPKAWRKLTRKRSGDQRVHLRDRSRKTCRPGRKCA